jgi:predicted small secreted protein
MKLTSFLVFCLFLIYTTSFSQETKQDSLRKVIESTINLEEVVISGKKKVFFETASDRFIFNIGISSLSVGSNAWDVLTKIPLINIEQEKISILGCQNATVYINNRRSILKGIELQNYLKSMPSDNINKIEIITSPSAKYDSSDGCIIIIVLKKTEIDGTKGNLSFINEQKMKNSTNFNGSINYHKNKYSQNLTFYSGYNQGITNEISFNEISNDNSILNIESRNYSKDFKYGGSTSFNYAINEHNILGAIFELHINKPKNEEFSFNYEIENETILNRYKSYNNNSNKLNMLGSGIFYNYNNENTSRTLDISLDFFRNNRNNINLFQSDISNINIDNENDKNNYTFKIDYSQPLASTGITIETGINSNLLITDNSYNYKDWNGIEFINNPIFSNIFKYEENINAFYITLQKKNILKKLNVNIGIRYENTRINLIQKTNDLNYTNNYFNILPSANVSYSINKTSKLVLSYRSMLWRPYANELNPFIYKINDNYWTSGNSDLNKAKINAFRLNYFIKNNFFILFSLENVNNPIINNIELNNNITINKPQNFDGNVNRYYFGLNYYKEIIKNKLTTNLSSGVYYIDNSNIFPDNKNSFYNRTSLSLDGKNILDFFNFNAYFSYRSSYYLVNKFNNDFIFNTFDFSKTHKSITYKIGFTDPFNLIKNKFITFYSSGSFNTESNFDQRAITLSIVKTFGNDKTKKTIIEKIDKGRSQSGNSTLN